MSSDLRDRLRAAEESDRSFAVEASAGTGKTKTLIDRILNLVLKADIPLSKIAAITFTEKAAGEMKVRLRQEFEKKASHPEPVGSRARNAIRDLEVAAISTIHAFAVSLLKQKPVEAGLDPRFSAMDEIQSQLLFNQVWESWMGKAIRERRGHLERALRGGLGLEALGDLAGELRLHSWIVRELTLIPPPGNDEIRQPIEKLIAEAECYLGEIRDSKDKLAASLRATLEWLRAWPQARIPPKRSSSAGAQDKWSGGWNTVRRVRKFIKKVEALNQALSMVVAQRLLHESTRWLVEEFLPEWENQKRVRGLLDFDDQLIAARELLRSEHSRAVRRYFQEQYATILVDEFQDTDPIQLDIVLLLSSIDLDETNPTRLKAAPGRLFIVGDPKQSIYRFRGADIETYLEVVNEEKMQGRGLERLKLSTNFRSVPSILAFVDAAFAGLMKVPDDGWYQPVYLPFEGEGTRKEEHNAPAVHILQDDDEARERCYTAKDSAELEASHIAQLIRQIYRSERWKVYERGEGEPIQPKGWRVPGYGDISVLLPVLSKVDVLEDALRQADIPYVLEGGKFYYARSEVSSAITLLRAVDNPNDSVALYGALRSIFFGLSDEDLLRSRLRGEPLDYRREVPQHSPLAHPFAILRELYERRHERPASETFEILLRETGARDVLAARPAGFQSLANLGKLARTLRARQLETTFSQVVEFLRSMDEEELDESESRIMEERSDAVRVMTIHKAKGLDFPIVIVAGLGFKRQSKYRHLLADPHQRKVYAVSAGTKDSGFRSPGWPDLMEWEKRREDAELVRLLYVAMTRARDHLVISTHIKWKLPRGKNRPVRDLKGTRLERLYALISNMLSAGKPLARRIDLRTLAAAPRLGRGVPPREKPDWVGILRHEYGELRRLRSETPWSRDLRAPARSAEGMQPEDAVREELLPETVRDRGIRIGIAFHEAMENADFHKASRIDEWAMEAGRRQKLDEAGIELVQRMMRTSFESELIRRARATELSGGKIWREIPFVRPIASSGAGPGIEEGKIDLLFEEHGDWVMVDYKTDQIPTPGQHVDAIFRERYASQIEEYAAALRALGLKVKGGYLLLARTGQHIDIPL